MTVRIKGLDEFRAELRKVDKNFGKAFGKANEAVGRKVVDRGGPAVKNLPSPGGSASLSGIKASKNQRAAVVKLHNAAGRPLFANVFGANSHWVWGRKLPGSGPWQPWLGDAWTPEQLYGIGPVITDVADGFALDEYMDAVMEALKPAFPD